MPRTRTYGLDNDTLAYAARAKAGSGKTILPENLRQINKFVIGIKKLGLWNSMVCYPMRSIHNAGTGSTVYSLGGLGVYNGTMVNGPTWQSDGSGIFFDQVVNYKRVSIPTRTSRHYFSIRLTSGNTGRFTLNTNQVSQSSATAYRDWENGIVNLWNIINTY